MKKQNLTSVQIARNELNKVNAICKGAKSELDKVQKSIFSSINYLNKLEKGSVTGIVNTDDVQNIKRVCKYFKDTRKTRYGFDVSILPVDSNGKICILKSSTSINKIPQRYNIVGMKVNSKGIAIWYYIAPTNEIPCTARVILNEFLRIMKNEAKANVNEAKANEAKANEAKKFEHAKKVVFSVFGELASTFTSEEIMQKYAIIKTTK